MTTGQRECGMTCCVLAMGRRCLLSRGACDNPVVRCPVVVGRDGELAALAEVFGQAASGPGACVVVTGEAGVGKTRLVTAAAGWRGAAGGAARPPPPG